MENDEYVDRVVPPFHLSGVTFYLTVFLLTETLWNQRAIPRVTLTNQNLPWNPNSLSYEDQEKAIYGYHRKNSCSDHTARGSLMLINQITSRIFNDTVYFTADANFVNTLESNVKINISNISNSDTRYGNIKSK